MSVDTCNVAKIEVVDEEGHLDDTRNYLDILEIVWFKLCRTEPVFVL